MYVKKFKIDANEKLPDFILCLKINVIRISWTVKAKLILKSLISYLYANKRVYVRISIEKSYYTKLKQWTKVTYSSYAFS